MDTNVLLSVRLRNSVRHKLVEKCLKMSVGELVDALLREIDDKNKAYNFIINKGLVAEFSKELK